MSKKETQTPQFLLEVCRNCMWFTIPQGAANVTCKDSVGVVESSPACKDFTPKPFNPTEIKKDKFFLEIRKKLGKKRFKVDKSVLDELRGYFVVCRSIKEGGKKLKRIPICSYGPKEAVKLVSLFEETQALRDRSLSIKLGMLAVLTELKSIEALGRQYIYEKYGHYLQSMKSEAIREINISLLLDPITFMLREISHILEISSLVYDNLKDTYFTLKEVKDIACAFLISTRLE